MIELAIAFEVSEAILGDKGKSTPFSEILSTSETRFVSQYGTQTTADSDFVSYSGNINPDKMKSTQKIDGIVAAIMALEEWMTAQVNDESNPYENRGLLTL